MMVFKKFSTGMSSGTSGAAEISAEHPAGPRALAVDPGGAASRDQLLFRPRLVSLRAAIWFLTVLAIRAAVVGPLYGEARSFWRSDRRGQSAAPITTLVVEYRRVAKYLLSGLVVVLFIMARSRRAGR